MARMLMDPSTTQRTRPKPDLVLNEERPVTVRNHYRYALRINTAAVKERFYHGCGAER
jgi:hypothetical protein